jgi:hypothetical protein
MKSKARTRKRELEKLIEYYTGIAQQWQQKQQEATRQTNDWVTKLFGAQERLAEVKELIGEEDVDELDDDLDE